MVSCVVVIACVCLCGNRVSDCGFCFILLTSLLFSFISWSTDPDLRPTFQEIEKQLGRVLKSCQKQQDQQRDDDL